jgi:pimeloyl-ACP methyl ester carboxylesterase
MTDPTYTTVIDAVFAMNAYEHNPDDGSWTFADLAQFFPDLDEIELGDYVLADVSTQTEQKQNNFFAISYTSNSGTIIAYRGTTNIGFFSSTGDLYNGYGIALGSPYGNDANDAVKFYQQVADLEDDPPQGGGGEITVVGHSLGGGLAGFVGAIYGLQGVLFDNVTFNNAAANAYTDSLPHLVVVGAGTDNPTVVEVPGDAALKDEIYGAAGPYPNNLSGLSAYAETGQFLSATTFLQTPSVQSVNPNSGFSNPFGSLHDVASLTMLLFAQVNTETAWQSVGVPLFDALFNDDLAADIYGSKDGATPSSLEQALSSDRFHDWAYCAAL